MASNDNSPLKPILIVALLLSLGANAFLFIKMNKKNGEITELAKKVEDIESKNTSLSKENVESKEELAMTVDSLEEFRGKNTELDSMLDAAQAEIKKRKARIKQLEGDVKKKDELEKELTALKELQKTYVDRIDSFITVNNMLKQEIVTYQATVALQSEQITVQQAKINKGSILGSDKIVAIPQKQKSNGKFVPTSIASKTSKVEICFNLLENKIADVGTKTVHLQVVKSGGEVLGTDASTFEVKDDNTTARYTTTTQVDYQNQPKTYCTDWKYDLPLTKGEYSVKVYTDGYFSGAGVFILK